MPSHGKYYDQNHAPARAWPDKSSSISDRSDSLQRPLAQAVAWVLAARPLRPLAAAWETLQALLTLIFVEEQSPAKTMVDTQAVVTKATNDFMGELLGV
jgi:hypothetical protein